MLIHYFRYSRRIWKVPERGIAKMWPRIKPLRLLIREKMVIYKEKKDLQNRKLKIFNLLFILSDYYFFFFLHLKRV
jgi:hypothetical protein